IDLCAILGNLLDNALEAAGQVPEKEERFVRLTIRRINQMLIIKVENSFSKPPVSQDGVLTTSKEKNGLHGWGLKSAQTAAEKYDGTLQTSYNDNIFKAVATLSYQCVS
ncbi:MAG: ATP-binding protein, partial [Lachnospiraceae bacterium]|nr:ATP-binding protein [Lachnospiraceae bacterium]